MSVRYVRIPKGSPRPCRSTPAHPVRVFKLRVQPSPSRKNKSQHAFTSLNAHRCQRPFHGDFAAGGLWCRSDVLVSPPSLRFGYPFPCVCVLTYDLQTRRSLQSRVADNCQAWASVQPAFQIPRAPVAVARLKQTGHRAETCKGGSRGEAASNPVWKRSYCGTQEWHPRFSAPSSTIFWSQLFFSLCARSGTREESLCHLTIRFRFPVAGWGVAWGCASRHFTRIADGRWDAFLAQSPHPWQLLGSNESWSKSRKK